MMVNKHTSGGSGSGEGRGDLGRPTGCERGGDGQYAASGAGCRDGRCDLRPHRLQGTIFCYSNYFSVTYIHTYIHTYKMRCANMAMELETEKKKRFVTKVCTNR